MEGVMKYCQKCGAEMGDDEKFCSKCGHEEGATVVETTKNKNNGLDICIKVFLIIGCVVVSISTYLIGLLWCLPMTIVYFNKTKNGEKVGVGFKVCTLLFVSLISGILMLCKKED